MKKLLLVCIFAIGAMSSTGCIISSGNDSTVEIFNDSDFTLIDIAFQDVDLDNDFGPNLAPSGGLFPGESIVVDLDCGDYDVFIEDELNTQCTIVGVDVCFDDVGFVIDNAFLATCGF